MPFLDASEQLTELSLLPMLEVIRKKVPVDRVALVIGGEVEVLKIKGEICWPRRYWWLVHPVVKDEADNSELNFRDNL